MEYHEASICPKVNFLFSAQAHKSDNMERILTDKHPSARQSLEEETYKTLTVQTSIFYSFITIIEVNRRKSLGLKHDTWRENSIHLPLHTLLFLTLQVHPCSYAYLEHTKAGQRNIHIFL